MKLRRPGSFSRRCLAATIAVLALGATSGTADPPASIARQSEPASDDRQMDDFRRIYALADGEALKRIGPPFPDCRMAFWRKTYPRIAHEDPRAAAQYIRFKAGEFNYWGGTLGGRVDSGSDLATILNMVAGVPRYLIEGDPALVETRVSGDFVYREGATADDIVPRLSEILEALKLPVRFSVRDVVRKAYVATGQFQFAALTPNAHNRIVLGGRPAAENPLTFGGGGSGTFDEFVKWLGDDIRFPVVSEVADPPKEVSWFCYTPDFLALPGKFAAVAARAQAERDPKAALDIITEQTGLTFTGHFRKVRVVVVAAAERPRE